MTEHFKQVLIAQFEASLSMMNECVRACPPEHWDSVIGKYPFWMVAYHTLCFVDVYLAPCDADWQPRTGGARGGLHPLGRTELDEEYPSRRFDQSELGEYVEICRAKLHAAIAAESPESLQGASGFPRLRFSRAELHLYNLRHLQHHTGQLSASLRRIRVDTAWVKTGWR